MCCPGAGTRIGSAVPEYWHRGEALRKVAWNRIIVAIWLNVSSFDRAKEPVRLEPCSFGLLCPKVSLIPVFEVLEQSVRLDGLLLAPDGPEVRVAVYGRPLAPGGPEQVVPV